MNKLWRALIVLASLAGALAGVQRQAAPPQKLEPGKVISNSRGLHGYISFTAAKPPEDAGYNMGMGFYAAVWPLIDEPLSRFQIGLPSTWIVPDNSDNKDVPLAPVGTHARDNWPERAPT